MDLSKSYEFFHPESVKERIHIIGCGAIGSTVAEMLARYGLTKISLYDFDVVESHNIANQLFTTEDLHMSKVDAVARMLTRINPDIQSDLKIFKQGYDSQRLSGYVILCVDNIDLRRKIAEANRENLYVKAMFDFRMRLTDAQHYAAEWSDQRAVEAFLNSMAFSHEEAQQETPVSACNMTLSSVATVRMIVSAGVANLINYAKGGVLKKMILIDTSSISIDAF